MQDMVVDGKDAANSEGDAQLPALDNDGDGDDASNSSSGNRKRKQCATRCSSLALLSVIGARSLVDDDRKAKRARAAEHTPTMDPSLFLNVTLQQATARATAHGLPIPGKARGELQALAASQLVCISNSGCDAESCIWHVLSAAERSRQGIQPLGRVRTLHSSLRKLFDARGAGKTARRLRRQTGRRSNRSSRLDACHRFSV